jgi:hypothetical protein
MKILYNLCVFYVLYVLKVIHYCCSRFSDSLNYDRILKHLSVYFCDTFKYLHTLIIVSGLLNLWNSMS